MGLRAIANTVGAFVTKYATFGTLNNPIANKVGLYAQSAGNAPYIVATGTDPNIALLIGSKGTGPIYVYQDPFGSATLLGTISSAGWAFAVPIQPFGTIYTENIPVTGFSITCSNASSKLILNPAGTLATGTITLKPNPFDGEEYTISSSQTITLLTLSPNTGQTIRGTITTLAANSFARYVWLLGDAAWQRVG
jgi:hypothetical protein